VSALLAQPRQEELRAGLAVVLAGPPNSGKSSLLNALVRREAALVTAIAGTTRDLIEVPITAGGMRFRIIDTAGVRETTDEVERLGIDRARAAAGSADLLIWLGDGDVPASASPTLAVHARADLPGRRESQGRLAVSAVTGEGLEASGRCIER
jgi:tRNA modification GTPase